MKDAPSLGDPWDHGCASIYVVRIRERRGLDAESTGNDIDGKLSKFGKMRKPTEARSAAQPNENPLPETQVYTCLSQTPETRETVPKAARERPALCAGAKQGHGGALVVGATEPWWEGPSTAKSQIKELSPRKMHPEKVTLRIKVKGMKTFLAEGKPRKFITDSCAQRIPEGKPAAGGGESCGNRRAHREQRMEWAW